MHPLSQRPPEQSQQNLLSALNSSILYEASQSLVMLCMGLGFWYGGTLFGNGEYPNLELFVCFSAVIFGA
jgi:ATP-binding cassette, subfamily B (MDR/TAP), member 1